MLDDTCGICSTPGLFLGNEATIGTGERLLCGVPLHLSAAVRTRTLAESGDRRAHSARNASSAALVIRYWEPIFLAFRVPSVMAAMTSASVTPRNFAASGSPMSSAAGVVAPTAGAV